MNKGSIIFVKSKSTISTLIRIFQKLESKNYNFNFDTPTHVEMAISPTHSISAESDGVKIVPIDRHPREQLVIYEPNIKDPKVKEWQEDAISFLLSNKNFTPYDYWGLASFILRALHIDKYLDIKRYDWKWANFCSELIGKALTIPINSEYMVNIKESPGTLSPEELHYYVNESKHLL